MFPGQDVSFDGVNTLNQFVTFGIATAAAAGSVGPIDWATLAQQWIQMRDHNALYNNAHHIQMPEAPPPPNISGTIIDHHHHHQQQLQLQHQQQQQLLQPTVLEEKGEADMDMDDEEEHKNLQISGLVPSPILKPAPTINTQSSWLNQKLIPTGPQWSWPARGPIAISQDRMSLVASSEIPPPPPSMTTQQQSTLIPSIIKMDVPIARPTHHPHQQHNQQHHHHKTHTPSLVTVVDMNSMEAAKRKILPAWLREGIEKMEREKFKQMEREQQHPDGEVDDKINNNSIDGDACKPLSNVISNIVNIDGSNASISKTVKTINAHIVASDDELEENSSNDEPSAGINKPHNSDYDDQNDVQNHANFDDNDNEDDEAAIERERSCKTYEEKVSDLMMIVRRTLTELLLDVTNTEISNIAHETLKAQQAKASSAQVINKSALSSITGKLGLAVYEDSSSDGDTDTEAAHNSLNEDNNIDSEEELKQSIRIKRKNFERIIEKLEEEIAVDVLKDEERLKYEAKLEAYKRKEEEQFNHAHDKNFNKLHSTSKTYDKDFGEATIDASLLYSNGKYKQRDRSVRKERTTRFSDNTEPKNVALATAANYLNQFQQQNFNKMLKKTSSNTPTMDDMIGASNSSSSSSGLNNMLWAAEAALKKATKSAASLTSPKFSAMSEIKKKNERRSRSRTRTTSRSSSRSETSISRSPGTSNKDIKSRSTKQRNKSHRRHSGSASSDDKFHKRSHHRRDHSRNRTSSSKKHGSNRYERRAKRQYSRSDSRSRSRSRTSSSRRDRDHHKSSGNKYRSNRSCSSSRSRSSRSHSTLSSAGRRKY